jgi:hypothetical protein
MYQEPPAKFAAARTLSFHDREGFTFFDIKVFAIMEISP